jgi:hypothetical protein
MEDKHYERLGSAVRKIAARTEDNMALGKLVLVSTEIMLVESERDARDQANGKGDKE